MKKKRPVGWKLSDDDKKEIVRLSDSMKIGEVARIFNVHEMTVYYYRNLYSAKKEKRFLHDSRSEAGKIGAEKRWKK